MRERIQREEEGTRKGVLGLELGFLGMGVFQITS